jgi:transposase-like protein
MVSSWETEQTKPTEYRTMIQKRVNKGNPSDDGRGRRFFCVRLCRSVIEEFLEAEMAEAIGAEKGERVEGRFGLSKRLLSAQLDYSGRQA